VNAQTAFAQRVFAILWDKAGEGSAAYDTGEVREWLETEGWEALFPGHCFACHMNEHDRCGEHDPLTCTGCVKEGQEHQLTILQANMGRNAATWKILEGDEPLTKQQVEDILNGKPIEEMKKLKDIE